MDLGIILGALIYISDGGRCGKGTAWLGGWDGNLLSSLRIHDESRSTSLNVICESLRIRISSHTREVPDSNLGLKTIINWVFDFFSASSSKFQD
jgi:hypothetical protein